MGRTCTAIASLYSHTRISRSLDLTKCFSSGSIPAFASRLHLLEHTFFKCTDASHGTAPAAAPPPPFPLTHGAARSPSLPPPPFSVSFVPARTISARQDAKPEHFSSSASLLSASSLPPSPPIARESVSTTIGTSSTLRLAHTSIAPLSLSCWILNNSPSLSLLLDFEQLAFSLSLAGF